MLGRGLDHLPLPTQPPTSEMVQVYPYRPFVGVLNTRFFTFPKEGLGNRQADTNMLILLNMTRNRDFPASQYLPFSGNWCLPPPWEDGDGEEAPDGHAPVEPGVEDDYEIPACMCLGRELLLDDFLVRSSSGSDLSKSPLALITKFMHVRVTNVACGVQTVKADPDPDPWPDIIHHSVPEPSGDFTVQVFGKYIPRFHFDREHVATSGSRPGDDFYRFRPLDTANGVAWYWTNSHDIHGKERSHEETSLDHFFGVKAKARGKTIPVHDPVRSSIAADEAPNSGHARRSPRSCGQ